MNSESAFFIHEKCKLTANGLVPLAVSRVKVFNEKQKFWLCQSAYLIHLKKLPNRPPLAHGRAVRQRLSREPMI